MLALFALTYGLHGRLVGLLTAPISLAGGLIGLAWLDRHIRARFETRTDAIRQVLLRQLDKPRPSGET